MLSSLFIMLLAVLLGQLMECFSLIESAPAGQDERDRTADFLHDAAILELVIAIRFSQVGLW